MSNGGSRPPNRSREGNVVSFILGEASDQLAIETVGPISDERSPRVLSRADLHRASAVVAAQLAGLGVGADDRVLAQVDKSLAAVALYLGVQRLGAVFVPLNVAYTPSELDYFAADAEPTLMVGSATTFEEIQESADKASTRCARLQAVGPDQPAAAGESPQAIVAPFAPRAQMQAAAIEPRAEDDLAAILYTSGTTGRSKGAMITHGNLASNAHALIDGWQFTEADTLLHVLPIFHVHGLFVALNVALAAGARVRFHERFDPASAVRDFEYSTVFMGVPTHYGRLLGEQTLQRDACRTMRLFTSGSAPLDPVRFEEFRDRTGQRILERYGMTEAGMITSNPYFECADAESWGAFAVGERVAGSVGFPLEGVQVRIRSEGGDLLEAGSDAVGVLEAAGPNVFRGYWRMPEKTAEAMTEDGYLISGDLAHRDADGRLRLVGRTSELIIVGGYNVYPREIEDCLSAVDGVADVAIVGVPHPDMGEGVIACIVEADPAAPVEDEALLVALSAVAAFKRPRRFYRLAELPRNAMGKVQKANLKERFRSTFQD